MNHEPSIPYTKYTIYNYIIHNANYLLPVTRYLYPWNIDPHIGTRYSRHQCTMTYDIGTGKKEMKIEFKASLWATKRDHEDETKITLCCDAQQLSTINQIPTETLLSVTTEWEGGQCDT